MPYLAALLLSIGFLIEIRMLRNPETPRFHFFAGNIQPFYKYMVILFDLAVFSFAIVHTYDSLSALGFEPYFPETYGVLSLTLIVILLLIIDIFRFSAGTSFYIGILGCVSVFLFSAGFQKPFHPDPARFFSLPLNVFYMVFILISSALAAIISSFFRTAIIRSRKKDALQRFLPENVTREILSGEKDIEPGGKRSRVTVL